MESEELRTVPKLTAMLQESPFRIRDAIKALGIVPVFILNDREAFYSEADQRRIAEHLCTKHGDASNASERKE